MDSLKRLLIVGRPMSYDAHLYCKFISKGYESVQEYKKLWFPNIKSDDQITRMAELVQHSDG
jgi:hypothetical protein